MDWFACSAPIPGAFDIDVGVAFVASVVGFVVAFAPAVLAVRYAISTRGIRGLIPKLPVAEGFGRASRRAA